MTSLVRQIVPSLVFYRRCTGNPSEGKMKQQSKVTKHIHCIVSNLVKHWSVLTTFYRKNKYWLDILRKSVNHRYIIHFFRVFFVEFPGLCSYCERMKARFWPDWDDCITQGGSKAATNWLRERERSINMKMKISDREIKIFEYLCVL